MIGYLLLVAAIVSEVAGTLALRVAARGGVSFYAVVVVGYMLAFTLLWGTLRHGIPLGVAYGIWAAAGVALTAVMSRVLFGEPLTRTMLGGIALIAVGVLLVELGANH
ncbi:DMT family transporter [Mycolicibacterium parafortuitum]|uniref:Cation transporter n=1 Tax=Mycolicibacterium parafortuitum TaxID=39692 RepID=A0A375YN54_MYCPF|nr:SMR family transporter [Mycolicibacterium parafortuitum]ORB26197.1 QacE family quaternary ammonium compound efflux SMR transporter [Mycolicibacterium parafortuitum]BBY76927.1 cation transporter [Mycolicibacterium parafortuitum]SRX82575.1 cation/cationic drug transporter [Brachybacterium faecium DSM 4810] [Mycolicibacterium parafortuitum]